MPIQSCWILWTDLTKSCQRLTVLSKLVLYRVPKEQRDGATIREEQQTSAEIAEGELAFEACVASVRSTGKVMELREDKARWFCIKREAELAKCGFSKDLQGMSCGSVGETRYRDLMARSAESASEWL